MPKRLKFRQALTLAAAVTGGARGLVPAAPAGDLAERATRARELIAARRPELRECVPGIDPWGAVELVRDAFECGDLPDALRALRWAAGEWLFALAPKDEWEGNPSQGLACARPDAHLALKMLLRGDYALAERLRQLLRSLTYHYRTNAERCGNPDLYPPRYVRLASDWAVWCRRARCALLWLCAAEGAPVPPDSDHGHEPEHRSEAARLARVEAAIAKSTGA